MPIPDSPWVGSRLSGPDAGLLVGPSSPPVGAVTVNPGVDNAIQDATIANPPGTTFWLAPGIHTNNFGDTGQIIPKSGNFYIGAPGAVLSGQNSNHTAFGGFGTGVTIRYLEVRDFASPRDQGSINHDGMAGWTVEYCKLWRNRGAALFMGPNSILRHCLITLNGQYGFQGFGGNELIEYNEVSLNGTDDWEERVYGCGCVGATKFWDVDGATIRRNWIHQNYGPASLWADTNNRGFLVEENYINDNWGVAIEYEISYNIKISNNNLIRNAHGMGKKFMAAGDFTWPNPAIYISESGGDSRVFGGVYSTCEISNNRFYDNWGNITLWENGDRFGNDDSNNTSKGYTTLPVDPTGAINSAQMWKCGNPNAASNTTGSTTSGSTTVTTTTPFFRGYDRNRPLSGPGIPPGATVVSASSSTTATISAPATATASGVTITMGASLIATEPFFSDCRWKTQNFLIEGNHFELDKTRARIPVEAQTNGACALFSEGASFPDWSPYLGGGVQDRITFNGNNVWQNNTYVGHNKWLAHSRTVRSWEQWRSSPFSQDAGSTYTP